jgi:hypothetical protein
VAETVVVKVKPGSRKGPLVEVGDDGELTVYVQERAVDGKANEAVIRVLAEHLGVHALASGWSSTRRLALSAFESTECSASVRKLGYFDGGSPADTHARAKRCQATPR